MTVQFFKDQLDDAVKILAGSVARKSSTYDDFKEITLVSGDGMATLSTSDYESMTCSLVITCKTKGELNIGIPFYLFRDLLNAYWGDSIKIGISPETDQKLVIESGMAGENITTIPVRVGHSKYRVDPVGTKMTVLAETLQDGFRSVVDACSKKDEARATLEAVNLSFNEGRMRFVGTDGFRMSVFQAPFIGEEDPQSVNLHRNSVLNILKMINRFEPNEIDVYMTKGAWYFDFGDAKLEVKTLDNTYPDIDTMTHIFQESTMSVICSREDILDCLKTTSAAITKHEAVPTFINLVDGELVVSAESVTGEIVSVMDVGKATDEFQTSFNGGFMLGALKTIPEPQIFLGNTGTLQPLVIRPEGREDLTHVIMPMHMKPEKGIKVNDMEER
jgi:DNA polymerase III sliding clamp (beta) subunit (PCNA family)